MTDENLSKEEAERRARELAHRMLTTPKGNAVSRKERLQEVNRRRKRAKNETQGQKADTS